MPARRPQCSVRTVSTDPTGRCRGRTESRGPPTTVTQRLLRKYPLFAVGSCQFSLLFNAFRCSALDNLILGIGRLLPDMTFNVTRPNGTKLNALVEVTLDRVLKAVLIFKGLMIEWVVVKGFAEESVSTDGVVDVWSDSRYKVFRKITENANAAMLNFQSPVYPEVAIKSFMVRFAGLILLFLFDTFNFLSDLLA